MQVRVAQVQTPAFTDTQTCLQQVSRQLETLAPVDLVTLPEMFCCPYQAEQFPRYAEAEGGRLWQICSDWAKRYRVYLSAGTLPERDAQGRIYNTAYFFAPDGRQIAKHRKMHLFDIQIPNGQCFQESLTLSAGDSPTVAQTAFGRVGLCVCYDIRFPELARQMALEGAELVLVPAAFNPSTGPCHWELCFRSRALDNAMFYLGTAPARSETAGYVSWGHSIAVDPWGTVLAQLGTEPAVQYVTLDLERVAAVREQLPLLRHRRTELYELRWKSNRKKETDL